jgi:CheY-like chemotaxis protein
LERLLLECGRLVTDAHDHERTLRQLLERIEGEDPALRLADTPMPLADAPPATVEATARAESQDLAAIVRRLYAGAQQQRRRAEAVHTDLLGEPLYSMDSRSTKPVVLVVDDSKDAVETVALFLELSGFHPVTASNGLEAIVAAHYARPQVAVLDVAMPVMDGVETARLLKASPVTRNIRLMAYTAHWPKHDATLREVFAEVLAKPASADEFLATIQQLAAGEDAAAASS